ncbi:MAG: AMP-binding protein, partial [Alphaproteobacteria bacterium]
MEWRVDARHAHLPSERRMRALEGEPLPANVGALLASAALRHGERAALVFFDDGETITYRELASRAALAAGALRRLGVGAGVHVGLMLPTSSAYPVLWLALLSLGAVTVPINHGYTARELHYALTDSDAAYLVIGAEHVPVLESVEGWDRLVPRNHVVIVGGARDDRFHRWEGLVASAEPADPPASAVVPDDLANIQYTSGTTGWPKGALLTHRYWLTFSKVAAAQIDNRFERILIAQPFYYVDAQWMFLMALWRGAAAYVARRQSASRFRSWLHQHRINYCNLPEVVAKQPEEPIDRELELTVAYAYGHRRESYAPIERRFRALAREGFAMTEIGFGTYLPIESAEKVGSGSCGIPTAFREVKIVDEAGRPTTVGEVGELWVTGPGILLGYYAKPEATAAALTDGWFHTGDLFREDRDGFYYLVGRMKEIVRRSGENVSAREVEAVLKALPEVLEAAVVPVPD